MMATLNGVASAGQAPRLMGFDAEFAVGAGRHGLAIAWILYGLGAPG